MAFIIKRLNLYCKSKGVPLPTRDQRQELGKVIAKVYHTLQIKRALCRHEIIEDGQKITVLSYPHYFITEIDKQIDTFYIAKVSPLLPLKPIKRPRISRHLAYSSTSNPSNQ